MAAALAAAICLCASATLRAEDSAINKLMPRPQPQDYVTTSGNQLIKGTQPVRLWGATVSFPIVENLAAAPQPEAHAVPEAHKTHAAPAAPETPTLTYAEANEAMVARLKALGFNAVRLESDPKGAHAEAIAHFVHICRQQGVHVWNAAAAQWLGQVTPENSDALDDPTSDAAWRQAVAASQPAHPLAHGLANAWDPRLELLLIARLRDNARLFNPATGMRWADEPAIAIWDLAGEEHWMQRMLQGEWQTLPPFFVNLLLNRWEAWLVDAYESDAALANAWGSLLPGETLAPEGAILLLPLRGPTRADLQITALSEGSQFPQNPTAEQLASLSKARSRDVDKFLSETWTEHKRRVAAKFRRMGESCRLSPLPYHTRTTRDPREEASETISLKLHLDELPSATASTPPKPVPKASRPAILLADANPSRPESTASFDGGTPWRLLGNISPNPFSAVFWQNLPIPMSQELDPRSTPAHGKDAATAPRTPLPPCAMPETASLTAAGIVYTNGWSVPAQHAPVSRRETTIEEPSYLAIWRARQPLNTTIKLAEGTKLWLSESTPAPDNSPAPTTTQTPQSTQPEHRQFFLALLAGDGLPLEQSRRLTLIYASCPANATPTNHVPLPTTLSLEHPRLLNSEYRAYDIDDRPLTRGSVHTLPFEIAANSEIFRVTFTLPDKSPTLPD